jgi:hypothetical protein
MDKKALLKYIEQIVDDRVLQAKKGVESCQEAANSETKSTAGDKHDTARELMQQEKNKAAQNLANQINLKKAFVRISPTKVYSKIEFGAMVQTDDNWFFIGMPLGNIQFQDQEVTCVSPVSPIAKVFQNKEVGDSVIYNGIEHLFVRLF